MHLQGNRTIRLDIDMDIDIDTLRDTLICRKRSVHAMMEAKRFHNLHLQTEDPGELVVQFKGLRTGNVDASPSLKA